MRPTRANKLNFIHINLLLVYTRILYSYTSSYWYYTFVRIYSYFTSLHGNIPRAMQPRLAGTLCLQCCKHIANRLKELMTGSESPALSMSVCNQLLLDVMLCERALSFYCFACDDMELYGCNSKNGAYRDSNSELSLSCQALCRLVHSLILAATPVLYQKYAPFGFELAFVHCESGALSTQPLPRGPLTSCCAQ